MQQILQKIGQTVHDLTEQGFAGADTAVVLGTGLGSLFHHADVIKSISFQKISNFPVTTVEFQNGNLIIAQYSRPLFIFTGK
jgi:purine nucleoside phosphorylase